MRIPLLNVRGVHEFVDSNEIMIVELKERSIFFTTYENTYTSPSSIVEWGRVLSISGLTAATRSALINVNLIAEYDPIDRVAKFDTFTKRINVDVSRRNSKKIP